MADFPDIVEAPLRARFVSLGVQPDDGRQNIIPGAGATAGKIARIQAIGLLWCGLAGIGGGLPLHAAEDAVRIAVASRTSEDYVRTKLPDGSFQAETYALGEGGYWDGEIRDPSINGYKFPEIAKVVAAPLRLQNYLPGSETATTRLLIMVYWGTTRPATTPGFQDRTNFQNARMLGFDSWWAATARYVGTPFPWRNDMLEELEERRYFVVLMVYDFQLLLREKKPKLLWETRFSIPEWGHEFDHALPAMALQAARYFGRDSHGLVLKPPAGSVTLDELKIIGVEPQKK